MSLTDTQTKFGRAADSEANGPLGRVSVRGDGAPKVRGAATYALEQPVENVLHCVLVQATIGAGRVVAIDKGAAEAAPGVRLVLDTENSLKLKPMPDFFGNTPPGDTYVPFAREVRFNGELVAAVVADTLEEARAAADLLDIAYEEAPSVPTFADARAGEGRSTDALAKEWGEPEVAYRDAPVRFEGTYETPREYNVPIEPHGLIAHWEEDDRLTIYEPTQWVDGTARNYAGWFGLAFENVRIVSPYIGGGFGSKAQGLPHSAAAAIAAKMLGRPVKLAVTRPQTFTAYGGRPATRQTLKLSATPDGKLVSLDHDAASETSVYGNFAETLGVVTKMMYAVPNFRSRQRVVPVNTVLPGPFRAPGKNPSAFALECAMDELAVELGIDPVELRRRNEPDHDYENGKPWSSRRLLQCYDVAGEAFGWAGRNPEPRSMRDGRELIGWGMAVGTHPVYAAPGEATVRVLSDGSVEVLSSAIDMGTGTYTILAQTAADVLGVPVESVSVKLGDSRLGRAPVAGGSQLANLMTAAVHKTALAARDELVTLGLTDPRSPLRDQANTLTVKDGRIGAPRGAAIPVGELLSATGRDHLQVTRDTLPPGERSVEERQRMFSTLAGRGSLPEAPVSKHSFCAHFIEVRVDEDFGTVRVSRVVTALDAGRLYNPKLAESQFKGGIVMGIGMALLEEGVTDPRNGRILSSNLADYRIATNADVPDIETISVGEPDYDATPLGGKAVGELAIVGVAPAIANAVCHATGKRVRSLPITLESLL
ncbi:xanthine dehydrogenase family protein molybdopterin-binding subunit [Aurantimonas sp. VKM B-3413]|uniref:xanthine dehydrogenase family protein molybdopterin-binding subunit n=1 Tax=Aurantimonas sp. VKM B-3413 TaxID=2779401 RepID=UPI001E2A1359|nr:xanthine dehydrogenase family protein molybdopterin-binding subunit [Aurantimonas sp. VKM B-3413]MCB8837222.1 xanthine dehydrogenase family protein molybdopterin-binding subunit [Aurantimonas sp. VKM B-3413]